MAEFDAAEVTARFGQDQAVYGQIGECAQAHGRSAAFLSAGSSADTPALAAKGDPNQPNEDALLVADHGERTFLAVADAHGGIQASHELVDSLAANADQFLARPSEIESLVARLARDEAPDGSATTLVSAVYDREAGRGFGLSFGDSSLVLVGETGARRLNPRNPEYLNLRVPASILPGRGHLFSFFGAPGHLLLAFTDGVDECHYRSPSTSVREKHLVDLFEEYGADPGRYGRALARLALTGVGGRPGGQDNIALVLTRTEAMS